MSSAFVDGLTDAVEAVLPTLEVRTASPTRAGGKIQVRVVWTEGGKRQLGYYSVDSGSAASTKATSKAVVEQVLRLDDRCRKAKPSGWAHLPGEVLKELARRGGQSGLSAVCKELDARVREVAASGRHTKARTSRNRKRARDYLQSAFDYVLREGLSDAEVRQMLREALVRHTMES